MDIESLRYPSWCLCRLLDVKVGTKEEVVLRRKCNAMYHYMMIVKTSHDILHSGSDGEGFNLPSSDVDLMVIDKNIVIQENIRVTRSVDESKTVLLMRRGGCNPGFVTLQLLGTTNNSAIIESAVEYRGHSAVSSVLFRDANRLTGFGEVGHGPCNTCQPITGKDMDNAFCFECNKWPTEANEFIYRQRLHGWPEKSLLDRIISRGCHLVPIGDKNHELSHIQWRLSFSAAEKDLIHSFNHTQFLVYGLLKIFLKKIINRFHLLDGILCSYFLKTAMFYSIEDTPFNLWRNDLLILCFWLCINKLIAWVEQGYCPNYFVSQNNMFRNKVFGQHRHNLLSVLSQCKRIGWTCIYLCEDLQVLQGVVSYPRLLSSIGLLPSGKKQEFVLDTVVMGVVPVLPYATQKETLKALARSITLFINSRTKQEKDISTILLSGAVMSNAQLRFCIDGSTNNKDKYKSQRLFMTSSEGFGYGGLFSMATFYHKTGQYLKAICILERVISMLRPYVLYHSFLQTSLCNSDLYERHVCGRSSSIYDKLRFAYTGDIFIVKNNKALYPVELSDDIDATAPFPLCIPPLPYTMFLLFLCHHKLGNIDKSISVLHDLEVLGHDVAQRNRQYTVVLNMLAVCLHKLGSRQGAVHMCLLSQRLKPDRNAAERLLYKILSD